MTEQQDRATQASMTEPELLDEPAMTAARRDRAQRPGVALALVFAGGTIGTAAREALTMAFPSAGDVPYATWAINVGGSLVLGLLLGILASGRPGPHGLRRRWQLAVGTGFCGGFTTYSTLAVQSVDVAVGGLWGAGIVYALDTVMIGAVAAWAGIAAGTATIRRRTPSGTVGAAR